MTCVDSVGCCSVVCGDGYYMEVRENQPLLGSAAGRHYNEANTFEKIWLACLIIVFTVGIAVGTYLLWEEGTPYHSEKFIIVDRRYWNTKYPSREIARLHLPVQYVLLTQTKTDSCVDRINCVECLKTIQQRDLEVLAQPDIVYNFVVGGDGRVYEGRGWYNSTGRKQFEKGVLVVAFTGTFDDTPPNKDQLKSTLAFLDFGVMRNKLDPCFQLVADDTDSRYIQNTIIQLEESIAQRNRC